MKGQIFESGVEKAHRKDISSATFIAHAEGMIYADAPGYGNPFLIEQDGATCYARCRGCILGGEEYSLTKLPLFDKTFRNEDWVAGPIQVEKGARVWYDENGVRYGKPKPTKQSLQDSPPVHHRRVKPRRPIDRPHQRPSVVLVPYWIARV